MKITLESTSKIVTLVVDNTEIRTRIWQGVSSNGIPVHAFMPIRVSHTGDRC